MPALTLANSGRVVQAQPGQTVLGALEAAGLIVRQGCRVGACRTCTARLLDGHISMPPGTALTEAQLQQHYFLPCVAVPRTDCTIELSGREGFLPVLPWTD